MDRERNMTMGERKRRLNYIIRWREYGGWKKVKTETDKNNIWVMTGEYLNRLL